jgi:hypothetical protein
MPYPQGTSKSDIASEIMHKYKHGSLKSGSGHEVENRKQAIAIAINEGKKYASK